MIYTQLNASHGQDYQQLMLMATQESPFSWITSHNEVRTLAMPAITEMLDHSQNESLIHIGVFTPEKKLIACLMLVFSMQQRLEHKATLQGLYVFPEFRRQGIARKMLAMCLSRISDNTAVIFLDVDVLTAAVAARQFYRQEGFNCYAFEPDAVKIGQNFYGLESLRRSVN
ncbi:MAG: GNAT family N-acetyltransferase [Methylococcales bacterium]|jgi:ribosomal protein S18 acetylase RimI-like enzyme|nr:GNAT family N-acetyltransferase [Methylococcales bacterium]